MYFPWPSRSGHLSPPYALRLQTYQQLRPLRYISMLQITYPTRYLRRLRLLPALS